MTTLHLNAMIIKVISNVTKDNREYFGGYDELVELNQAYITQEIDTIKEEITSDIRNQLISIFKRK